MSRETTVMQALVELRSGTARRISDYIEDVMHMSAGVLTTYEHLRVLETKHLVSPFRDNNRTVWVLTDEGRNLLVREGVLPA